MWVSVAISAMVNRVCWNVPIGPAERGALLDVVEAEREHVLAGRGGGHRDREPLLGQVGHQLEEPGPLLAEQVLLGTGHIVEEQLGGVLGVLADLVEVAAALEPVHAALDDEQADPLVPGLGVGPGDHDHEVGEDAVGDERLLPVEHVVVALVDGRGADALQVGPGLGLGHRDRRDQLAGRQPGNQRCFCSSFALATR
jgi:hypothetical protein